MPKRCHVLLTKFEQSKRKAALLPDAVSKESVEIAESRFSARDIQISWYDLKLSLNGLLYSDYKTLILQTIIERTIIIQVN